MQKNFHVADFATDLNKTNKIKTIKLEECLKNEFESRMGSGT